MSVRDRFVFGLVNCEHCGRPVALNRDGKYRRHYHVRPAGDGKLCPASRTEPREEAA